MAQPDSSVLFQSDYLVPPVPPKTPAQSSFKSEVIKALDELLKTEINYDVIIYIGENPDFKEFHAHSGFLCCRSDYFNKILSAKDVEKRGGKYIIKKPNITPQAFDIIIK